MPSAPVKTNTAAKPAVAKTAAKPKAAAARTGAAKAGGAKAGAAASGAAKAAKAQVTKPTAGAAVRPRDQIARMAEATGGKAKDLRPVVEAMLDQLGKSLDAGEILNLPPLGKLWVAPSKSDSASEAASGPMKLKLRRGAGGEGKKEAGKEALATPGQDS